MPRLPRWMHYCHCGKAIPRSARACGACIAAEHARFPESFRDTRRRQRVADDENNR